MQNEAVCRRLLVCAMRSALCVPLLSLAGCTLLGVFAGKVVPPPTIPAQYTGLADQTVSVMVWAGDGPLIDFPEVRNDLAGSLQNKLQQAVTAKTKVLQGATFPKPANSVVRFQTSHPEYESLPLTEVAPKLGTSRVIYVEVENLQTRSDASVELYRGSGSATLKVVEIPPGGGPGKVAYEESGISAVFPPKAREEGTPDGNDRVIYSGLVNALSSELAKRFVPHQEEQ